MGGDEGVGGPSKTWIIIVIYKTPEVVVQDTTGQMLGVVSKVGIE